MRCYPSRLMTDRPDVLSRGTVAGALQGGSSHVGPWMERTTEASPAAGIGYINDFSSCWFTVVLHQRSLRWQTR